MLTFQLEEFELWTQWCPLQTPVVLERGLDGGPEYHCAQTAVGAPELCEDGHPCVCSATSCRVASSSAGLSFDLTVMGTNADGTISGVLGDHEVHFVRD